jgi:hypothetical protein
MLIEKQRPFHHSVGGSSALKATVIRRDLLLKLAPGQANAKASCPTAVRPAGGQALIGCQIGERKSDDEGRTSHDN